MSSSEDEGDWGVIVTLVEHCEPAITSISGGRDAETRDAVPQSRKHATSEDASIEREVKRPRSPCPS